MTSITAVHDQGERKYLISNEGGFQMKELIFAIAAVATLAIGAPARRSMPARLAATAGSLLTAWVRLTRPNVSPSVAGTR